LIKNSLCFLSVLFFAGNVYAGSASAKLSVLAESLIKGYEAKAAGKATLAVFPFTCEEKLQKQRVGFAVSELMSHRFVADPGFTVVERGELNKLLIEQKLQASGITDSATAVKLGQMAGANALLLGNLNKVDGLYQVNARVVNVESGEVVVSGYTELPVDAFEDDAGVYLNLVPQEQTIGIYGVLNYRHNDNDAPAFINFQNAWVQHTYSPRSFTSLMAGGGLLYRPRKRIQINAELTTSKVGKEGYLKKVDKYIGPPAAYSIRREPLTLTTVSLMASYVGRLKGKWNYLTGAGLQYIAGVVPESKENMPVTPFLKTGVEYRLQSRIGLGLNLKYELKRAIYRSENTNNVLLKMNPLSFETVLAMYF